ncbi:MAG: LD-carboxypeptidase [Alphaproteobacteria bacterium]|jgi:muramoyltetrapeptide carboxypeptidase|nr:LD-carboxypeptidase [Alphaproteobacteria bacterium]
MAPILSKRPLLPSAGKIALISPSRWLEPDVIDTAKGLFKAFGHELVVDPQNFARAGVLAGTNQERADALMRAFLDPSIEAILCARGGTGATYFLDLLDYEIIKAHPKPLIGFSDVTGLLNAITTQTGVITYYGPTASYLVDPRCADRVTRDMLETVASPAKTLQRTFQARALATAAREGTGQGQLFGGNLSVLSSLLGTPYEWPDENVILLLEDVQEPLYKIERMINHLRLAGKLQNITALLVGEMVGILDDQPDLDPMVHTRYGRSLIQIIMDNIPQHVPVFFDLPIGHGSGLVTMPVGAEAMVTIQNNQCELMVTS